MSGRLKTLTAWAPGTYPAGPAWGGTVKRIPNGGRTFTPESLISAQEYNDAFGECIDNDNSIVAMAGLGPALNWGTADLTTGGSLPNINGVAYDTLYGRWLAYGVKPTVVNAGVAYVTSNHGKSWTMQSQNPSGGSPDCAIQGVIYNPTTGRLAVCTYAGVSGAGDVTTLTDEEARVSLTNANGKVTGIAFNGLYIFAGNTDLSTMFLKTSPLGSNVWTSRLPVTGITAATWCDGNPFGVACSGTTGTVIVVKLNTANYGELIFSTNGTTWTKGTHTATASWKNVGICYSVDRFIIAQTNGTDSRLLYSIDNGATWTTTSTITACAMGGIAAAGSLIFATTYYHLDIHGMWSTDGGITWQVGGNYFVTPSGAVADRVHSNGAAFVSINLLGSGSRMSFSTSLGAPGIQGY